MLYAVYEDTSPSMTIVRYWFKKFKRGRKFVFDEEQPGRPADVVTEEIIKKVHDIILADRRTNVREVAEAIGVSTGTAINILHVKLAMKKIFSPMGAAWDIAPAHSSRVIAAKLHELLYELLP